MVEKSSHYEYLATNMDDILIWSKDPMVVIRIIGKTYILESVGITKYYLDGNLNRWKCEIPWRSMEESGMRISYISKDLHTKFHSEI
jgi:hypothetical protein